MFSSFWHAVERVYMHCTRFIAPTYAGEYRKRTSYFTHNALVRVPSRAKRAVDVIPNTQPEPNSPHLSAPVPHRQPTLFLAETDTARARVPVCSPQIRVC